MGTIIKSIAFKNFYNYSGDYKKNIYEFTEGVNIVNADNGMGKSKLFNGFLWILRDKVYDSDTKTTTDINSAPLKILSDSAKGEQNSSSESGVKLIYEDSKYQYTIEKSIKFTKKQNQVSFNDINDWKISDVITRVTKCDKYSLSRPVIIYDVNEQISIIRNLISPAMYSYALLQGEAIDEIVDLSNSVTLTSTIETLTDLSSLKQIEKSCQYLSRNAKNELAGQQKNLVVNLAEFQELIERQAELEKQINNLENSKEIYQKEYDNAVEIATKLESQISNTEERIRFQTEFKSLEKQISELEIQYHKRLSNINNQIFRQPMPWLLINTKGYVQKFGDLRDKYTESRTARKLITNPQRFATLLPEGSPDDISLKKMLEKHQCFVCGRTFLENSEEESKIKSLLDRSSSHAQVDESDLYLYFDSIQKNVAGYIKTDPIFGAIGEEKAAIEVMKKQLIDLRKKKSDAESEYFNYGGSKELMKSDKDNNLISKYNKAINDVKINEGYINQTTNKIKSLKIDLEAIEKKIDNLDVTEKVPQEYEDLKNVVLDAEIIFENTRKRIYNEVIKKLETRSNDFYSKLTSGNNVMGGKMVFEKTITDAIEVKVFTDSGSELTGASEGFQRMKKIAVVMAIISSKLGGGKFTYPFIADAPFSAFGKNFINNFFDTVPDVFDQSIILIKDLYDVDDPQNLSEDGHKILEEMISGKIKGSFYTNRIPVEADTTKLSTIIERYK